MWRCRVAALLLLLLPARAAENDRPCLPLREMVVLRRRRVLLARNGTVAGGDPPLVPAMGTVGLIVSAEYGSDGGGWTDVRAAVEKHGIAVVKETTPGPSDDSDHLRVVYSLRGEGGMLDFNRPSVGGLPFFAARKLNPSEKYGCAVPQAGSAGPFQFATGCSCPVGQRCRSRVVDFVHSGVKYTSSMGLCGCCAGWVIALVIGVPVLCLVTAAGFCTRPFARLTTHVLGGREKALAKYRRVPPVQTQPAPGDNPNPLADDVWSPVGGAMSQRSAASSTSPRLRPVASPAG
ncbi:hypothetical protein DIPPA_35916 [Diplonema papillatum]|nr:hypothetical protein DIPPA_35916 [Diplonema papillatum]